MLNKLIAQYKKQDGDSNAAFVQICNICKPHIESAVYKYKVPGCDIDDLRSFAIEQIYDCLSARKTKHGKGEKKILSENDDVQKNLNYIKSAIKYKLMREYRRTKGAIKYSYNIDILQENGEHYTDRENNVLDIGINFVHKIPYLYENNKNTKIVLNIPHINNKRSIKDCQYANPIDHCLSFDYVTSDTDDDEKTNSDFLEYEYSKNHSEDILNNIKLYEIENYINSKFNVTNKEMSTIKQILQNTYNTRALNEFIKSNKKQFNSVKKFIEKALMGLKYYANNKNK